MYQLRIYDITPDRMDEFVTLFWRVAEIRRRHGFEVIGPWIDEEANQFVWIVGYDGPEGFEAAAQAYYESPERAALSPDPADFLEAVDTRMLAAVSP